MHPGIPICLVFFGCCLNNVFLELIVSEFPGAGNIVTFSQFLFIAVEGFIFTSNFGTKPTAIPMKKYISMVLFFFVVQVLNNMTFMFNIPMTLHIIFRAGSLIASLTLGIVLLGKKYPASKIASVILITIGIIMCTFASASQSDTSKPTSSGDSHLLNWVKGITMMSVSLFLTARLGIFQEQVYKQYGKHPKEALFYNHGLPLPGFLLVGMDIYTHAGLFNTSELFAFPLIQLMVPKMWLFLLGNVITQYICIRSVFILTTECSALTVTLVVTLRKFASLILSIVYFNNPFTLYHYMGAACVFIGTFIFTEIIPVPGSRASLKDKKKK